MTIDLPNLEVINIRICSDVVGEIIIANLENLKRIVTFTRYRNVNKCSSDDADKKYYCSECHRGTKGRFCDKCSTCKKCDGEDCKRCDGKCCEKCSNCTMCGKELFCKYCSSHNAVIRNCECLQELDIGDYCFYGFNSLIVGDIPSLRYLNIGSYCFRDIRQFCLSDQHDLEYIEIGQSSFMISSYKRREDGQFFISCCPKLKRLIINDWSFHDYSSMELRDLEALEQVCLGNYCFRYANLSLQSMLSHFHIVIVFHGVDLPQLQRVALGHACFADWRIFSLKSM